MSQVVRGRRLPHADQPLHGAARRPERNHLQGRLPCGYLLGGGRGSRNGHHRPGLPPPLHEPGPHDDLRLLGRALRPADAHAGLVRLPRVLRRGALPVGPVHGGAGNPQDLRLGRRAALGRELGDRAPGCVLRAGRGLEGRGGVRLPERRGAARCRAVGAHRGLTKDRRRLGAFPGAVLPPAAGRAQPGVRRGRGHEGLGRPLGAMARDRDGPHADEPLLLVHEPGHRPARARGRVPRKRAEGRALCCDDEGRRLRLPLPPRYHRPLDGQERRPGRWRPLLGDEVGRGLPRAGQGGDARLVPRGLRRGADRQRPLHLQLRAELGLHNLRPRDLQDLHQRPGLRAEGRQGGHALRRGADARQLRHRAAAVARGLNLQFPAAHEHDRLLARHHDLLCGHLRLAPRRPRGQGGLRCRGPRLRPGAARRGGGPLPSRLLLGLPARGCRHGPGDSCAAAQAPPPCG
mmetsp:Transcript_75857/g.234838  ORF Transcript_75857/g.234838 Transcript_75857/m.234838 type:complete len:461 (-) Transcript_75857:286-1668(-)